MDIFITVILLALAIILILAEIFLLPGITIGAFSGAVFTAAGFYYAYSHLGVYGGNIALLISIVIFLTAFFWLLKSKKINKIALNTDIQSTVADGQQLADKIKEGDEGITVSRLNPMGKVRVGHSIVEAKTLGDFVDENTSVVVLKVYPSQIIVKPR